MVDSFILFHSTDPARLQPWLAHAEWTLITCLRGLALFSEDAVPSELLARARESVSGIEMRTDEEAYGFLLEVICGLHSPIVGETEVMGQFKASCASLGKDSPALPFLRPLLGDAKKIRTEHLSGQGSQSYGSLCRRELAGMHTVHLLGAGKLTKDLLPWFLEFPRVEVYCRSLQKGGPLKDAYPKVEIFPWSETAGTDACADPASEICEETRAQSALIIAAPISEVELTDWMDLHGHSFGKVIDLRGEVSSAPVDRPTLVDPGTLWISLAELFRSVQANQAVLSVKVAAVRAEIEVLVQKKADRVQIRPLGWDEICA